MEPRRLISRAGLLLFVVGVIFVGLQAEFSIDFTRELKRFPLFQIDLDTNWPGLFLATVGIVLVLISRMRWPDISK